MRCVIVLAVVIMLIRGCFIMIYIICMFLYVSNFVYGMEVDKENLEPKNIVESTIIPFPKMDPITRKINKLEMDLNCYVGFVDKYESRIDDLIEIGFFTKEFAQQNEAAMQILHDIFSNKKGGENWDSIPFAFKNNPKFFFEDMEALHVLIKSKEAEQNERIQFLLNEMRESFLIVQWMVIYYWNNKVWFLS